MITVDWMHSWASGPMAEVTQDPLHLADVEIVAQASPFDLGPEASAAIERMRQRGIWCHEEGGRRYAAARRAWSLQTVLDPSWKD